MRMIVLNPVRTILMDIVAWVTIHLTLGYLSSKIPLSWLNPKQWLFQTFAWEKGGKIYETLFRVRSWKKYIPNGSGLYRGAFSIKNLPTYDVAYLERWLKESVRTEICHWLMIIPGFFFFLWNDVTLGWINVAYAFLNNLVPIIVQRFNRPRIRRLLAQLEKAASSEGIGYAPNASRVDMLA